MFEFANQTNIESDHDRPDGLWISGFALRSPCGLTSAEAAEIEHCYTTPWDAIWPWNAFRYGIDLIRQRDRHYLGHNPLGSYMIIALLALVGCQAIFGLLATEHNSVTWGPLALLLSDETSEWFGKMHGWLFEEIILVFIFLHIVANVLYRLIKKDQLIEAMVIGTKPLANYEDQTAILGEPENAKSSKSILRALICLALATAIFAGTIIGLGSKLFY